MAILRLTIIKHMMNPFFRRGVLQVNALENQEINEHLSAEE
jgi:hypothetical protein